MNIGSISVGGTSFPFVELINLGCFLLTLRFKKIKKQDAIKQTEEQRRRFTENLKQKG